MPDIDWNISSWNKSYDWSNQGEEWSESWGSSFTQWVTTIYPRIAMFFPAENVLEIAPGYGRWTRFLIPGARKYRGIDIAESCIKACKSRFSAHKEGFFVNDGKSLNDVSDISYDLVFSFDSLVHVDIKVLEGYFAQILKLLAPNGVAFIHHSNIGMYNCKAIENRHFRDESVNAVLVEEIISKNGGKVLTQELVTWGEQYILNDCFTLFGRAQDFRKHETKKIISKSFMDQEVNWAKDVIGNYHVKRP